MYCINCGVKLEGGADKCPLCNTVVPIPAPHEEQKLYPSNKLPKLLPKSKALSGSILIILFIPLILTFFSDFHDNRRLDWFGFVAGALLLSYILMALPIWFRKPNPVIFIPCDFLAVILYVGYIDFALKGGWFWTFALPAIGGFGLLVCALITLLRYIKKGQLFIIGSFFILLGGFIMMLEGLMAKTFQMQFTGWSFYPLVTLVLLGGMLVYLAINKTAREIAKRKLFF